MKLIDKIKAWGISWLAAGVMLSNTGCESTTAYVPTKNGGMVKIKPTGGFFNEIGRQFDDIASGRRTGAAATQETYRNSADMSESDVSLKVEQPHYQPEIQPERNESKVEVNVPQKSYQQAQPAPQLPKWSKPLGKTPYSFAYYSINDANGNGLDNVAPNEMEGAGEKIFFLNKGARIITSTQVKNFSGYNVDCYLFYIKNTSVSARVPTNSVLINAIQGIPLTSDDRVINHPVETRKIREMGSGGCYAADFRVRPADESPERAIPCDAYVFFIYPEQQDDKK